ncbi:hypothetical protein ACPEEZ_09575 [Frigoribacterium sp. 2-23]|uniref:hypothetical protein n=1 Tax=Frigoribacterium sp. 2-23 TaxID=3415006 RepID=UPI003C6F9D4E
MQLYAASASVRARQITADVISVAAIVVFVLCGVATGSAVAAFGDWGRQVEEAGLGFQGTMRQAAGALGDVPLLGGAVSRPFDGAGDAAGTLVDAGREQQRAVTTASVVSGLAVAVVPSAIVVTVWLRRRLAFVRRASSARRLLSTAGGDDLLALQALGRRDQLGLVDVVPDPVAAWRSGDPTAVRALADLTLRDLGVRRPRPEARALPVD